MIRKPIASGHPATAPSRRSALRIGLASVGALSLAGCDRLSKNPAVVDVLKGAQHLSHGAQRLVAPRPALAQEFGPADVAVHFRANGTLVPRDADYQALMREGFKTWQLQVGGRVEQAATFTLADLRAMPSRTQITRHDCVEGWSAIGKWKGVPLAHLLAQVRPRPNAR